MRLHGPGSESEIVEGIAQRLRAEGSGRAIVGLGDDAAILPRPPGPQAITVDTVTEGQDFLWRWPSGVRTSLEDVGWKLAAQNLSDINAMAGVPSFMVLSCTLSSTHQQKLVGSLISGVLSAAKALGQPQVELVGGDTGKGEEFSASLTVTGDLQSSGDGLPLTLLRNTARPGDRVLVSGGLGRSGAGLDLLQNSRREFVDEFPSLVRAQLRPRPNLNNGMHAALAGVKCGIDVSDGLLMDAWRIANSSSVTIDLDSKALLPFTQALRGAAEKLGVNPERWVFSGGEDYALLITAKPDTVVPEGFVQVGNVHSADGCGAPKVTLNGTPPPKNLGWDPFM